MNQSIEPQGALDGFRLQRLEVLNWGTFDQKIWHLGLEGDNSLLTGNIGSGKSTLVDGLTTLLVPTRKLAFNKAAGAEEKERSLESYFHGYYTSQQDDYGKAKAVGLRGGTHYSVLLADFYSAAVKQPVTLAQVFWLKPGERKVRRLFIVAETSLTIARDFSSFGSKINELRKKLRKYPDLELFDSFGLYQQAFSKLLGLGSDGRALELFNQTISMKSVGSVTDFVRQNMLEQPDIEGQLIELERNYDDLKRLHDVVIAARQKVQLLEPIDRLGTEALTAAQEKENYNQSRELTESFIAGLAVPLYQTRLSKQRQQQDKLVGNLVLFTRQHEEQQQQITQLNDDILNNGGGRLQQLQADISRLGNERDTRHRHFERYQHLALPLGLDTRLDAEAFVANLSQAHEQAETLAQQLEQQEQVRDELKQQLWQQQSEQQQLSDELQALNKRQSNIPLRQLDIREQLCSNLGVTESALPFVGELLQVKAAEQSWQGAVERVLHNFSLSLLVPEQYYAQVSQFIENTHLGARLVYYRIRENSDYLAGQSMPGGLPGKVDIKPDSVFYPWLDKELKQRFNYHCCDSLEEFRRNEKAITHNGQMKSGPSRHEKDDRHALHDKSRYVLGWSNKEKIQLLAARYSQLQSQVSSQNQRLEQQQQQREQLEALRRNALNLADFDLVFEQINWPALSQQIEQLQQQHTQLVQTSDRLNTLQQTLLAVKARSVALQQQRDEALTEKGTLSRDIAMLTDTLASYQALADSVKDQQRTNYYPLLAAMFQQYGSADNLRIEMLANQSSLLRSKLNEKIQHLEEKRRNKESQMIGAMGNFSHAFPNDVVELDRSLQSLPEYQVMLHQLQLEDLPRHEARFKEMLNRDTIRAMALFRSYLDRQEEEINARIHLINESLHTLDYQPGTYIEVDGVASPDIDIREFKQRLKQCVEYSTDDNLYSEQKFEQVKSLIEQMRNEPKWTQKVVDVRYWHLFNVIERYREDHSEKECYSDSGGKSGGQKEKLAYSILAAAILLQYRLVGNEQRQHSRGRFNLVVIDEAFARGSKDSTRFGLELFKKLGLQLLLVTPLQKLDVIEHYVSHVHFVDQRDNRSMVLNMTIEEYRERVAHHQNLRQQYGAMVKEVD